MAMDSRGWSVHRSGWDGGEQARMKSWGRGTRWVQQHYMRAGHGRGRGHSQGKHNNEGGKAQGRAEARPSSRRAQRRASRIPRPGTPRRPAAAASAAAAFRCWAASAAPPRPLRGRLLGGARFSFSSESSSLLLLSLGLVPPPASPLLAPNSSAVPLLLPERCGRW